MEIEQSLIPITVNFSPLQQQRILQILSALEEAAPDPDGDLQLALLFELLGRLCRAFSQK